MPPKDNNPQSGPGDLQRIQPQKGCWEKLCCCCGKKEEGVKSMSVIAKAGCCERCCPEKIETHDYDWGGALQLLLLLAWFTFMAFTAKSKGSLGMIVQPYDQDAKGCGVGENKNYPYLFFGLAISKDQLTLSGTICVKECPKTSLMDNPVIDCLPTSRFKSCANIPYYSSYPVANKFCFANTGTGAWPVDGTKVKKSIMTINPSNGSNITTNAGWVARAQEFNKHIFQLLGSGKTASDTDSVGIFFLDIKSASEPILFMSFIALGFGILYYCLFIGSDFCVSIMNMLIVQLFFFAGCVGLGLNYWFSQSRMEAKVNVSTAKDIDYTNVITHPINTAYVAFIFWGLACVTQLLMLIAGIFDSWYFCKDTHSEQLRKVAKEIKGDLPTMVWVPIIGSLIMIGWIYAWCCGVAYVFDEGKVMPVPFKPFGQLDRGISGWVVFWQFCSVTFVGIYMLSLLNLITRQMVIQMTITWFYVPNRLGLDSRITVCNSMMTVFSYMVGSLAYTAIQRPVLEVYRFVHNIIWSAFEGEGGTACCAGCWQKLTQGWGNWIDDDDIELGLIDPDAKYGYGTQNMNEIQQKGDKATAGKFMKCIRKEKQVTAQAVCAISMMVLYISILYTSGLEDISNSLFETLSVQLVVFISTFFIADNFVGVQSALVDSVLMCYLVKDFQETGQEDLPPTTLSITITAALTDDISPSERGTELKRITLAIIKMTSQERERELTVMMRMIWRAGAGSDYSRARILGGDVQDVIDNDKTVNLSFSEKKQLKSFMKKAELQEKATLEAKKQYQQNNLQNKKDDIKGNDRDALIKAILIRGLDESDVKQLKKVSSQTFNQQAEKIRMKDIE